MKLKAKRFVGVLCKIFVLLSFIFVVDLILVESLDTEIMVWRDEGFKVEYIVPNTAGGTSKCYSPTLSKFTHGQKVAIKRSAFFDVCLVLHRSRDASDKNPNANLFNRHLPIY